MRWTSHLDEPADHARQDFGVPNLEVEFARRRNIARYGTISAASSRKIALAAGVFYLLTFVSIPTLALYGPVHDPNYIVGPGPDTPVLIGGVLEIIVALAGIGTAVALYPVVKRQNEGVALGFVGSRVLEAAAIFAGVVCLLSVVTLRQAGVGADALVTGQALVALYDRLFLLGQSLMPAVNALLLGSLLYRSRLVPRVLPLLGLIGAPLLLAGDTRHDVRPHRTGLRAGGARRTPDRAVGVFAGRLARRKGVQSISNHSLVCKNGNAPPRVQPSWRERYRSTPIQPLHAAPKAIASISPASMPYPNSGRRSRFLLA